jgi:hypothetical protein
MAEAVDAPAPNITQYCLMSKIYSIRESRLPILPEVYSVAQSESMHQNNSFIETRAFA